MSDFDESDEFDPDKPHAEQFEMEMPFLPVKSKGGPHDDSAYVAGWEMARIDTLLQLCKAMGLQPDMGYMIHTSNREQADLVGLRHGFVATFDEMTDEWCGVEYIKMDPADMDDPRNEGDDDDHA